jgi:membrane protein involved in colicin uptake
MMGAMMGASAAPVVVVDNGPVHQQTQKQRLEAAASTRTSTNKKQKSLLSGKVSSPFKHHQTPKKNQRQLRKMWASNQGLKKRKYS